MTDATDATDAARRLARLLTDMWFEAESRDHSLYPSLDARVRSWRGVRRATLRDVTYDADRNRLTLDVVEPGSPTAPDALDQLDATLDLVLDRRRARLDDLTREPDARRPAAPVPPIHRLGPDDPGALDRCATCRHNRWRHTTVDGEPICTEYADCACGGEFVEPVGSHPPPPPPTPPLDPADFVTGDRRPSPNDPYVPPTYETALALVSDLRSELATAYADLRAARGQRS